VQFDVALPSVADRIAQEVVRRFLEPILEPVFHADSYERYADDAICHCRTESEARALWQALASRLADCKLTLHPEKTKIVYCKDANRKGDYPDIRFDFLGFQFRARKTMWTAKGKRIFTHGFLPAASPKALQRIGRDIRSCALHHRSDKSLHRASPCLFAHWPLCHGNGRTSGAV
jgi:hypothetical protein